MRAPPWSICSRMSSIRSRSSRRRIERRASAPACPGSGGGPMNILLQPAKGKLAVPQHLLITCVPWRSFEKIVDALSEHHLRITYDRGALELLSPVLLYERWKLMFSRLLGSLTAELRFPLKAYGSTTFCKEEAQRGLE